MFPDQPPDPLNLGPAMANAIAGFAGMFEPMFEYGGGVIRRLVSVGFTVEDASRLAAEQILAMMKMLTKDV